MMKTDMMHNQTPKNPEMFDKMESDFVSQFPQFLGTAMLDDLRQSDYGRIDSHGHIYLDYTGGGLYSDKQVQTHMTLLLENVFGNPHSTNPTSQSMTQLVESARSSVLKFFNASPEEYICIFTQNASGALKLIGESYPFGPGDTYLLTFDNHNSVNGIREFARAKGAVIHYSPVLPPEMQIDDEKLANFLDFKKTGGNNLFAYPAQSNFSGVQHSLDWIERAQKKGWDVLLDGAAFVPTNYLDLSRYHPDFVCLSFYKIFGYPTGVGALI
ncbi:MAG TPA: aminotransferase class V-fold PLP-dependent enzyme, partial [Leptolinea sp.]